MIFYDNFIISCKRQADKFRTDQNENVVLLLPCFLYDKMIV